MKKLLLSFLLIIFCFLLSTNIVGAYGNPPQPQNILLYNTAYFLLTKEKEKALASSNAAMLFASSRSQQTPKASVDAVKKLKEMLTDYFLWDEFISQLSSSGQPEKITSAEQAFAIAFIYDTLGKEKQAKRYKTRASFLGINKQTFRDKTEITPVYPKEQLEKISKQVSYPGYFKKYIVEERNKSFFMEISSLSLNVATV